MPKLCQVIAISNGKKPKVVSRLTEAHRTLQKRELFEGMTRTYRPKYDDGERLADESKRLQLRVQDELAKLQEMLSEHFDLVAAMDNGNCTAKANVVVDGVVLLEAVPSTHLLFLEKQLTDLYTLVDKLPVLDPSCAWKYDENANAYCTEPVESTKTTKVPQSRVLYDATPEHPAQVHVYNEDIVTGYWTMIRQSGAISARQQSEMLSRVQKLQDAVKLAREEANSVEVKVEKKNNKFLDYIFKSASSS